MSLPFNSKLKERSKELRKAGNLAEVLLWNELTAGKFKSLDFDRQKIIGNYIVDFFCANSDDAIYSALIVELRAQLNALADKIKPKVFEYGFLKT